MFRVEAVPIPSESTVFNTLLDIEFIVLSYFFLTILLLLLFFMPSRAPEDGV